MLGQIKSAFHKYSLTEFLKKGTHYFFWRILPEKVIWKLAPENKVKAFIAERKSMRTAYFYLRGSFDTEQRSLLYGQSMYSDNIKYMDDPRDELVRNIHRIEKGLSMPERRDIFADGYIVETVEYLIRYRELVDSSSHPQVTWAIDVLNEYFEVVEYNSEIKEAKEHFKNNFGEDESVTNEKIPRSRERVEHNIPSYENFRQLTNQRSSTRWFESTDVSDEVLDKAIEAAAQSPSACNRQSFEFKIYKQEKDIDRLTDLAIGVAGYENNIPCMVALVGKHRAYHTDRDRHIIYIDASLAAMSFQFALETLGLASCCINWPVIPKKEKEISNILGLSPDEEVVMLMAVGHPDPNKMVPYSEKKDLDDIRSYENT
ncbi:nitroreductase family protein [Halorubrum sp. AJ67]|uniref:nitroreductase family protein n=1 Tax=Halorubrum sp. AJ67 TaxID=1173487 RepID=UPI0009ADBD51|nr:nitroreductase family protein [Halorubrum sp. AJ67]